MMAALGVMPGSVLSNSVASDGTPLISWSIQYGSCMNVRYAL